MMGRKKNISIYSVLSWSRSIADCLSWAYKYCIWSDLVTYAVISHYHFG